MEGTYVRLVEGSIPVFMKILTVHQKFASSHQLESVTWRINVRYSLLHHMHQLRKMREILM